MFTAKKSTTLMCFSPPVMLATMIFEVGAALYLFIRQKPSSRKALTIVLLLALAAFQLAEYMLCGGYGFDSVTWSKVGYVSITILPAAGLHVLHVVAGVRPRKLVQLAYTLMTGFIVSFLTVPGIFESHRCTGNYVIFEMNAQAISLYTGYYYSLLLTGVVMGTYWAAKISQKSLKGRLRRKQLGYHVIGYLSFMLPVIAVQSVNPQILQGIPSVMCGFAVFLAIMLIYAFSRDKSLYKE